MDTEGIIRTLAWLRDREDIESAITAEGLEAVLEGAQNAVPLLMMEGRHDEAARLMADVLAIRPDADWARHRRALALGGKVERLLGLADRLRAVPPPDLLDRLEATLHEGIDAHPALADLHWDLAVIAARYRRRYAEAEQHLERALGLGYDHPAMARLQALIAAGRSGTGAGAPPADPEQALRGLILMAAADPFRPPPAAGPAGSVMTARAMFEQAAHDIGAAGGLDADSLLQLREDVRATLGGDAIELALSILRSAAAALGDQAAAGQATDDHLSMLAEAATAIREQSDETGNTLKTARRMAQRGLDIVAAAEQPVDPDTHANLLLALGGTYTHPSGHRLSLAFPAYVQALELKRAAGNVAHVGHGEDLLRQMIRHQIGRTQAATIFGGIGEQAAALEEAVAAAEAIGDDRLGIEAALMLGDVYSQTYQPERAYELLEGLVVGGRLDEDQSVSARFALASAASETGRVAEAQRLQEELLALPAGRLGDSRATLWLNYGNTLRELGDLAGAERAFATALDELPPPKSETSIEPREPHILGLQGELRFLQGDPEGGAELLARAAEIYQGLPGVQSLQFNTLAARCFMNQRQYEEAAVYVGRAKAMRSFLLQEDPTLPVLQSFLGRSGAIDWYEVEIELRRDTNESRRAALVVAEGAKGRVLEWIRRVGGGDAAKELLSSEWVGPAVDRVAAWAAARGARVVSVFAAPRGLALFSITGQGAIEAGWLEDFDYTAFAAEAMEPWEAALARSLVDDDAAGTASEMTDRLLQEAGEWIAAGLPSIEDGGELLVLLPHRGFRALPLSHARLPGGARLGERYPRVVTAASLHSLAESVGSAAGATGPPAAAFVDPDGSLPFSRLEGLAIAGATNTATGPAATEAAIRAALHDTRPLLISAHGDFDEMNPWRSRIRAVDGEVELYELLEPGAPTYPSLVVLGACETGRSLRTPSDEPLAFPSILTQAGVETVVAPAWMVDDFASLLFLTKLVETIDAGLDAAAALEPTAQWLRDLRPEGAVSYVAGIVDHIASQGDPGREALAGATDALREARAWLDGLDEDEQPFASILDWGAFQVTGVPA